VQNNHINKAAIAAAGGIPPLVALAHNGTTEEEQEIATSALRFLASGNDANKAAIAAEHDCLLVEGSVYWGSRPFEFL
jgi:hypothetical protein